VLKALDWGGGRHSILANTAIERIPTFHADHDYPQVSLGDAGVEFAEELFVPVFEQHLVFLFVRHEVPALPAIDPSPELGVIHFSHANPFAIRKSAALQGDRSSQTNVGDISGRTDARLSVQKYRQKYRRIGS
jgi:hypothetical protein